MGNFRQPKDKRIHVENIIRHYHDAGYLAERRKDRIAAIKAIKKKYRPTAEKDDDEKIESCSNN